MCAGCFVPGVHHRAQDGVGSYHSYKGLLNSDTLYKIRVYTFSCVQGFLYLVFTIGLKMGLSKALMVQDDAHVFQILKSKFTDFKNFDTQAMIKNSLN